MPLSRRKERKMGFCRLSGAHGAFVKAHILPAALTRLDSGGARVCEIDIASGVKERFVSWYDDSLVTREGEDILEAIDTAGIELLRAHKLVWSGWCDESEFPANNQERVGRFVHIKDARKLQLFFLSVAWRAAESMRPEFRLVSMSSDIREDIRIRVLAQDPGPFGDFPVQLFQIVSKGIPHNRTPMTEDGSVQLESGEERSVQYVRIYLEGLVARVHIGHRGSFDERYLCTCLRDDMPTFVFEHRFEYSRTAADLGEAAETVANEVAPKLNELTKAIRGSWSA